MPHAPKVASTEPVSRHFLISLRPVYAPQASTVMSQQREERSRELGEWLQKHALESYQAAFVARGYDSMMSIAAMTIADLNMLVEQLAMPPGHAGLFKSAYEKSRPDTKLDAADIRSAEGSCLHA